VTALLGCSGLSSWQSSCGGGREVVCCCLSVNVRKARCSSGRKPSPALLRVVVVTAPLGRRSPCWGHHYGEPCPETWGLGVKIRSSLLDERRWRHRCRTLLGGAAYGDLYQLVAVWGGLDGPCAAAEEVRKVFVLVTRCRGPMGARGLESARMAVVTSMTVERKWCSQTGFQISESLAEERRWVRRGSHVE
jgi:hypothetical protein